MPSICYTPTAPGIEELEVINVSLVLGKICVYVSQGNQTFKINLRDAILSDAKAITSLTRKMSIQKSNTYPQVDPTKLANVTSSSIRSRLIKFICIEETFVESIDALVSEEESIPPVKRRISSSPTPAVTLPPPVLKQTSPEEASSCRKETRLLKSPPPKATLSERALNLLKKGCLPLFPPARRDWGEEEITLAVRNFSITWPPKDWETLTPDRRFSLGNFALCLYNRVWTPQKPPRLKGQICWTNSISWLFLAP